MFLEINPRGLFYKNIMIVITYLVINVWCRSKPSFQHSLIFVGKYTSLPLSGYPERLFTRVGSGLTHKY